MDPLPAPLESVIQTHLRERQVYGLSLAAFDREGIRFAGGVGHADLRRGEPADAATVYRVASISKLLTTALVLRLVDSGHIALDDPVNRHLPDDLRILDRTGAAAPSTVRTLLSHTSGLGVGLRGAVLPNRAMSHLANQGQVHTLADAVRGLRLRHDPGEKIVYSNPAFNVLGLAAAHTLGIAFEVAARDHVLRPLGMDDSAFTPSRSGPGVATPYGSIAPPAVGSDPADGMRLVATPMGGLTSSVLDLARFGQMILDGGRSGDARFLQPETVAAATSLQATNHPGLDQGYGLGLKVRTWRGRRVVGHDGNMPGVATQLLLAPDDGAGVVVLTNGYALGVPHQIAAMALEHLLGLPAEPARPAPATAAATSLGHRAAGTYRLLDAAPPGVVGVLSDRFLRVRVTHEVAGRLRLDGSAGSDGPVWLLPDGAPGRYRVAANVDDGTSAVLEERPDGIHLWIGHTTHLHRR